MPKSIWSYAYEVVDNRDVSPQKKLGGIGIIESRRGGGLFLYTNAISGEFDFDEDEEDQWLVSDDLTTIRLGTELGMINLIRLGLANFEDMMPFMNDEHWFYPDDDTLNNAMVEYVQEANSALP